MHTFFFFLKWLKDILKNLLGNISIISQQPATTSSVCFLIKNALAWPAEENQPSEPRSVHKNTLLQIPDQQKNTCMQITDFALNLYNKYGVCVLFQTWKEETYLTRKNFIFENRMSSQRHSVHQVSFKLFPNMQG